MSNRKSANGGAGVRAVPADVFVGLGANLGEPMATLAACRARLAAIENTELVAWSGLYRTAPVGFADQPDFVNAVCHLRTGVEAQAFVAILLGIERDLGRVRTANRNGPRVIDIDLLFYAGITMEAEHLQLPHPRLHERGFVLYPWAELSPDLVIPGRGSIRTLRDGIQSQRVERLPITW
ncbi:MAG: 2-amino-4-hydroxy-6-hydroxymethyldihydropteridine diphosphokinase [Gammaproteobacteria bacterium]|nr:2-amino-4-hydroxy-6-hydroxymethyldihydropteridine diphosphokinase [Gammaproteobacteria bacterium]